MRIIDHPLRNELNSEVHARPSGSLAAPTRLSFLALVSPIESGALEWQHVHALAEQFGVKAPVQPVNHFAADMGEFSLRWERHAEFTQYTFSAPNPHECFSSSALDLVPTTWTDAIPGKLLAAAHGCILRESDCEGGIEGASLRWFNGNVLVGSSVGDDAAIALTDFRVQSDGFSRFIILDRRLTPRQAGRTVQRLLEIDTYRMMALLTLPVARALAPDLQEAEVELSTFMSRLESAEQRDEPELLDRLTRQGARVERWDAQNSYRFSAAEAYYELVQRRIAELREVRLPGLQTFNEFTERRLAPAMNTCRAIARRQETLAQRIARANQLLTTRVDITVERQNQSLLESMNRRATAQFKLQQTVEGLSIAAITYYVVGLIGYAAKAIHAKGYDINYELVQGVSIPIVVALIAFMTHYVRKVTVTHGSE
jgi:uncharacterized membrane-anchored protein